MIRRIAIPLLALLTTLAATHAGGWAVITVEDVPNELVVGQPVTLTYSVRQHGRTLLGGLSGRLEALGAGQTIRATATPGPDAGRYIVAFTPPRPGTWSLTSGFGNNHLTLMPIPAVNAGRSVTALSATDRGLRLFVAKGCATCHVHPDVTQSGEVKVGPDLSGRRFEADYLRRFLAEPNIATTRGPDGFEMPDLNLAPQEIAALAAFINGARDASTAGQ
jgi:hypothetical protein